MYAPLEFDVTRFDGRPLEQFIFRGGEHIVKEQRSLIIGNQEFSDSELRMLVCHIQSWLETGNLEPRKE